MDKRLSFTKKVIGKPWSFRSCDYDKMDCWGLVSLYYSDVLGVVIDRINNNESISTSSCGLEKIESAEDDCIFVGYIGSNAAHSGVIMFGDALHASEESQCVRCDKMRSVYRKFTKVEFYKHANN